MFQKLAPSTTRAVCIASVFLVPTLSFSRLVIGLAALVATPFKEILAILVDLAEIRTAQRPFAAAY